MSFLTPALATASLAWPASSTKPQAFVTDDLLQKISLHVTSAMSQLTSEVLIDAPCYPWTRSGAHMMSVPNDGGLSWKGGTHSAGEHMIEHWFTDLQAMELNLRDLYAAAPEHPNPSIFGVMGALLAHGPSAKLIPYRIDDMFKHEACPASSYENIVHMPAFLQALTHTVRAQYEAVCVDGTVFTNPRDIATKLRMIVRLPASVVVPELMEPSDDETWPVRDTLTRLNQEERHPSGNVYTRAVWKLYAWVVGPAWRWSQQGFIDALTKLESDAFPAQEFASLLELVGLTTAILVQELTARLDAAVRADSLRTVTRKVTTAGLPVIIHVTGDPGSGKSYIGKILRAKWASSVRRKVEVFETDSLWDEDGAASKELDDLEKAGVTDDVYGEKWLRLYHTEMEKVIRQARQSGVEVLVLIGLLGNWSHSASRLYPLHDHFNVSLGVYLEPPMETKWAQVLSRRSLLGESEEMSPEAEEAEYKKDSLLHLEFYEQAAHYTVVRDSLLGVPAWKTVLDMVDRFIDNQ